MSSISNLGDLGYQVTAVFPLTTSTAIYYSKTSQTSTGTKLTTSRTFDLSRALHIDTTGGKPLDITVHPRAGGPPRFKGLAVAIPLEIGFQTSGLQLFVTVAHKTRAAAAGAGSTWRTLRSDVRRFKNGTDTDNVFHTGFVSSAPVQAVDRYYKANITFATKKASDTGAKDTTSGTVIFCNSPIVILHGGDAPQNIVPKQVN